MTNNEKTIHQHRKDEHFSLAVKYWKEGKNQTSGLTFSDLRLVPCTFPELAVADVDLSTTAFGQRFEFPFYIEAMTGGTPRTDQINAQLARIAADQHLAMAVGSQSIALKFPELAQGFKQVRTLNPDGFLFANLGAHHSLENAKRAVDMIQANALEIHVNTAQELPMDEGERSFYWLENINEIATKLEVPVVVKEVGFGIAQETYAQLAQTNVAAINVGGSGGTNFAWIERKRGKFDFDLDDYGFSTVESLLEAQFAGNQKALIATGGISSAQDILKSLILGADMASSAGYILSVLTEHGAEAVENLVSKWKEDLRKLYTLTGAKSTSELTKVGLLYSQEAENFIRQRGQKNF